jgi:serine/threonine-protein kinase
MAVSALVGVGIAVIPAQPAAADDAVLDGTYMLYFGQATADGAPSPRPRMTYWYQFHTDCSSGCTATGDQVNTDDRSGPYADLGGDVSLQFLDGQWVRSGQYDRTCADGSVVRYMWSWTLAPQPDGSLTGTRDNNPSGRCPEYETSFLTQPITATRQG